VIEFQDETLPQRGGATLRQTGTETTPQAGTEAKS